MYGGYGGMSSYGGMYGGGYGSGYGYGMNRMGMQNPQNPNQDPNQQQNPNGRRQIMEEYFKMMGGLRSIVEIGFSLVALGNFSNKSWKLLKKIFSSLIQTSQGFATKISNTFSPIINKLLMISSEKAGSTSKSAKLFLLLRIISAISILMCIKLRKDIEGQAQREYELNLRQYQDVKKQEEKMKSQREIHKLYYKQGYF